MPDFTVRVELDRYATERQYVALHDALFQLGLCLFATGVSPVTDGPQSMKMPRATYYGSVEDDVINLRDRVVAIARAINPKGVEVFVAETSNWAQFGYALKS